MKIVEAITIAMAMLLAASCANDANISGPNRVSTNSSEMNAQGNSTSTPGANASTANAAESNSLYTAPAADFWTKAAEGGLAEIEIRRLAVAKAQNTEVKKFAQTMIRDHTNTNNQLRSLAQKKNVRLPTSLDPMRQQARESLAAADAGDFDSDYMDTMVTDHERMVQLFENQANTGTDADVKAFAVKTIPMLRQHLEIARSINNKLQQ